MQPFITSNELKTHTITRGDPNFFIQGKFTISPRASIQINEQCPNEHRWIIQQCLENGWIVPTATITEREKLFMGLNNE
jgi:hypothetical protein